MMEGGGMRDDTPDSGWLARLWPLLPVIFLPNLAAPLVALVRAHPTPLRLGAVLVGLAVFVAIYLRASWQNDVSRVVFPRAPRQRFGWWRGVPVVALVGVSVALILGDGPRWLSLLIFTGACTGGRFALSAALRLLATLALLTALLGLLAHDTWSDLASATFWTGMAGILTIVMTYLRRTNHALRVAREEVARLAVETERLRFARDLHDLLGHDLARIALQSEVAEALVPTAPERAMATMREVGGAARMALQEVRAAVMGYRQPALATELRGAGEILAAAGIAYQYEGERVSAPSAAEAVLAWAVREGVTNVVKHSRARRCTIRTLQGAGCVGVEVSDDGRGADATVASTPCHGGSGLPGLAERADALGGHCDAGPCPGGGFRLSVTLPLATDGTDGAAAHPGVEHAVAGDAGGRS